MKIKSYIFASLGIALSMVFSAEAGVRQGYVTPVTHNHHYDQLDWHYEDYADTSSGLTLHRAYKRSASFVDAATGRLHAVLFIGTNVKSKQYVHLAIKQQNGYAYFECQTCKVIVQFDGGEPKEIDAKSGNTDRSLSLDGSADLVEKIKSANDMKITAPVKDDGQITVDFITSDLEWPRDDKPAIGKSSAAAEDEAPADAISSDEKN